MSEMTTIDPETKQCLSSLLGRFFGINAVDAEDDFFDLGGNSLAAMVIVSQINELCDVELTVGDLFKHPKFVQICQRVSTLRAAKLGLSQREIMEDGQI